jgi:predicted amidohydrolase
MHAQPGSFRLAMVQMRVDGGSLNENVSRAAARIAEASGGGAQVVLLPEALTLGWTHPTALTQAEPVPDGPSCQRLADCARRHKVYVCAGLVERASADVFNAAVLLSPEGQLLLHHRKIHELDIGRPYYALGDRLQVASTRFGKLGLMICADAFAPGQVLARSLALMGAEIILSPCAWAVPAGHNNTREPYGQLWRDNYGFGSPEPATSVRLRRDHGPDENASAALCLLGPTATRSSWDPTARMQRRFFIGTSVKGAGQLRVES